VNLHEYQGKQLFAEVRSARAPKGYAAEIPKQAVEACAEAVRWATLWVVKGTGARGWPRQGPRREAGQDKDEIASRDALARPQPGDLPDRREGQPVSKILVESCTDIAEELYLGAVVDRSSRRIVLHGFLRRRRGNREGRPRDAREEDLQDHHRPADRRAALPGRELAFKLGLKGDQIKQFVNIFMGLAKLFKDKDLALIEVNRW